MKSFISFLSDLFESSRTLLKLPPRRVKTKINFLKEKDNSLKQYFVIVYKKKTHCYIVNDSTIFCYAFTKLKLPVKKKICIWAKFYKNWLYIEKYQKYDAKKFCYEYF
ncbi:hypothetical protein M153_4320000152 [Pseudoloma neurophilia]|uniref:Uncharacterized protein n=1 Tax=Pseudoloma neurophilia TaxID=146866 RepID=A0A0R0LTD6_9MICR|nr:hypothetical protein M153_4320000152 [Pseudoloma neurophilia]